MGGGEKGKLTERLASSQVFKGEENKHFNTANSEDWTTISFWDVSTGAEKPENKQKKKKPFKI